MTTKQYRALYLIFFVTSILLNVGPLAVYSIRAGINSDLVHEKVVLVMTILLVIIMTAVSLINKIAMRSRLWVILIGVYVCLDFIMTPLIIIAVCQIIDEIVITPLKHRYKNKLIISKEIDRRI